MSVFLEFLQLWLYECWQILSSSLGVSKVRLYHSHYCSSLLICLFFLGKKALNNYSAYSCWYILFGHLAANHKREPTLLPHIKNVPRTSEHDSGGYLIADRPLSVAFLRWHLDSDDQGEELNWSESLLLRSKESNNVTSQVALRQF